MLETALARREFFGDKDILVNMDREINELLDFSYSDQINPLLDPNNVHDKHLTDTKSEGGRADDSDWLICNVRLIKGLYVFE